MARSEKGERGGVEKRGERREGREKEVGDRRRERWEGREGREELGGK